MKLRDEKHLAWIKTLPCCVWNRPAPSDPAHIRKGSYSGVGQKPDDFLVVPLCHELHHLQHNIGEVTFWNTHGGLLNAKKLAMDLYDVSGDTMAALKLIARF